MKLLEVKTNTEFEAEIVEVEESDYKLIKKSGQYRFDWKKEKENHVHKIVRMAEENPKEIHGLISLKGGVVKPLKILFSIYSKHHIIQSF